MAPKQPLDRVNVIVTDIFLFHLEVALLSGALVGLYALRAWLGLGPLYVGVGVIWSFVLIGSRLQLMVPVLGGGTTSYSVAHVGLVLTSMALIYTLEGTREAQRLIGALCMANVVQLLLKLLLASQLNSHGLDLSILGRASWTNPSFKGAVISTLALLIDGFVILVVYQVFYNWRPRWPIFIALTPALAAAMLADRLVFAGLYEMFDWDVFRSTLTGHFTTGLAAAVPVSAYIGWRLRSRAAQGNNETLQRSALDVIDWNAMRRELEVTKQALQKTREDFSHIKTAFSRYTAPDVVEDIMKNRAHFKLGGEERVVTILFSDIRGYSTLSEQMTPVQVIELLNQYFGVMSQILDRERGTIIEFEGDAILAVFGAPLPQSDHALRAVRSALAMLGAIDGLNDRWEQDGTASHWHNVGLPSFRIRIGIHTGPVVVGNVGSERRTKYSVIGDTVNTASRVEGLNKELHTSLLLTDVTAQEILPHGFALTDMGAHQVKGRHESVRVYTVSELPVSRDNNTEDAMIVDLP